MVSKCRSIASTSGRRRTASPLKVSACWDLRGSRIQGKRQTA
jgi:hypothetical protein